MNRWFSAISRIGKWVLLGAVAWLPVGGFAQDFDPAHARFDAVLNAHVAEGRVDYTTLKAAPEELDAYLDELAAVPEA
jgi:hypothetical protein